MEEGGAEVVGGVAPLPVATVEFIQVRLEGAGAGEDGGGKEAEAQLEEAGLRVFLPLADDGEVFTAIWLGAVGDDFPVRGVDKVGVEGVFTFDFLSEVSRGALRPYDFYGSGRVCFGLLFLNAH